MARTHEGRACDAVIRRIEAREGHSRSDLTFPEKKQDWAAAVEVTCRIGDQLFAFEHTTIEPFERHLELEARASAHFQPIQDRLAGRLPPSEQFELLVPVTATLDLKGRGLRNVVETLPQGCSVDDAAPEIADDRIMDYKKRVTEDDGSDGPPNGSSGKGDDPAPNLDWVAEALEKWREAKVGSQIQFFVKKDTEHRGTIRFRRLVVLPKAMLQAAAASKNNDSRVAPSQEAPARPASLDGTTAQLGAGSDASGQEPVPGDPD